jgi:GNAT superfamily N-acetyltransferase
MELHIAPARPFETPDVAEVLQEAGRWLEQKGMPLWSQQEVAPPGIAAMVTAGQYILARDALGAAVGAFRLHEDDPAIWPDVVPGESLFLHQMALVRREAGKGMAQAMLAWAMKETKNRGKRYLRLDFLADRAKLRSVYEHCGFRHHSDRQVGPRLLSRYEFEVR